MLFLEKYGHIYIMTAITDKNIRKYVKYYTEGDYHLLDKNLRYKSINEWDVSNVTDMSELFSDSTFNEPIDKWDVSNVKKMKGMFSRCVTFNQNIGSWNVSKVTNMSEMFSGCSSFNKSLNEWDVSKVKNMSGMFSGCSSFNQSLNKWDVSKVKNMSEMFRGCTKFDRILEWTVTDVEDMSYMFHNCSSFNRSLNKWVVSKVKKMQYMFSGCTSFNRPLNGWDQKVGNVENMDGMFMNCTNFNQPLDQWNVSRVTTMSVMFRGCAAFNQSIRMWNVRRVTNSDRIFEHCPIAQENKPQFIDAQIIQRQQQVNAHAPHQKAAKINYEKLNHNFREKLGDIKYPGFSIFPKYIADSLLDLINKSDAKEDEKREQRKNLERIMVSRLNGLKYDEKPPHELELYYLAIEYVKLQPSDFKNSYMKSFTEGCTRAYNGPQGITCAGGALERIFLSFEEPITEALTKEGNKPADHKNYEQIIDVISANPEKMIPAYIKDWYKLHKHGGENAFTPEESDEKRTQNRRQNLKNYLLGKFPDEGELIEAKITEIADNIGYEDDYFAYGGRRRDATRKVRKIHRKTKSHR